MIEQIQFAKLFGVAKVDNLLQEMLLGGELTRSWGEGGYWRRSREGVMGVTALFRGGKGREIDIEWIDCMIWVTANGFPIRHYLIPILGANSENAAAASATQQANEAQQQQQQQQQQHLTNAIKRQRVPNGLSASNGTSENNNDNVTANHNNNNSGGAGSSHSQQQSVIIPTSSANIHVRHIRVALEKFMTYCTTKSITDYTFCFLNVFSHLYKRVCPSVSPSQTSWISEKWADFSRTK